MGKIPNNAQKQARLRQPGSFLHVYVLILLYSYADSYSRADIVAAVVHSVRIAVIGQGIPVPDRAVAIGASVIPCVTPAGWRRGR